MRITIRAPHFEHSFAPLCLSLYLLLLQFSSFSSFVPFFFSGRTRYIPNVMSFFCVARYLHRHFGAISAALIARGRARASMCILDSEELHALPNLTFFVKLKSTPRKFPMAYLCMIYYIIKIKIHSSCEIEDFVETHLCKLCVILRSRALRVVCPH